MDFIKWYKKIVESNNQEPPEFIWENIQDDLDIEQSWYLIHGHLDKKASEKRQFVYAVAAGIVFLMMAGGFLLYQPQFKKGELKQVTEVVKDVEKDLGINHDVVEETLEIDVYTRDDKVIRAKTNLMDESSIAGMEDDENFTVVEEKAMTNELSFAKLEAKDILFENWNGEEIPYIQKNKSEIEKVKSRTAFRKIYVGTTGQLANTWLLNDKTYSGLESSSLTTSNASFGYNWGIFTGTNLTKNIDLQLDLNIVANTTQNYNEYVNGHYVMNEMKFNYSQAALSFRIYFMSKRFIRGEHGLNMGGYWGYLHNAYQILDGQKNAVTSNYNSSDYGVFMAYEYIFPIYGRLGFGTGLKAFYGLQNIYAGDDFIPAYMNKTNNASLNISFSLKYSLR